MTSHNLAKSIMMAAGAAVILVGTVGGAAAQVGGRPEPVGKSTKPRTDEPMNPAKNAAAMKNVKMAECNDANMKMGRESMMKMSAGSKKTAAMKEMNMAKDMKAKKNMKGCEMHLGKAMGMMK